MNADLQSRFDRLDSALNTLVESLASYNPSPAAAAALVAADDHLTQGLDRLSVHQRNHHQIQTLRSTADSLEDLVKSTLLQLAEVRRDLRAVDRLPETKTLREVDYDQLLSYAQQIARFTIPPTYKPRLPPSIDDANAQQKLASGGIDPAANALLPSSTELAPVAASFDTSALTPNADSPLPSAQPELSHLANNTAAEGKAMGALPSAVRAWLEPPSSNSPFMPWPEEDRIRRGALGMIEESWDKGQDPSLRDIAGEAAVTVEDTAE